MRACGARTSRGELCLYDTALGKPACFAHAKAPLLSYFERLLNKEGEMVAIEIPLGRGESTLPELPESNGWRRL